MAGFRVTFYSTISESVIVEDALTEEEAIELAQEELFLPHLPDDVKVEKL